MSGLLLPRHVAAQRAEAQASAAASSIAGSRTYELQSDEFVNRETTRLQLVELRAYVAERRASQPDYNLPRPSGWKLMVLMLTLPEATAGGLMVIDDTRELRATTSPQGVLLASGPAAYSDPNRFTVDGKLQPWHEPGDRITWVKYDAHLFKLANKQLIGFLTDTQPVALIDSGWKDLIPSWQ